MVYLTYTTCVLIRFYEVNDSLETFVTEKKNMSRVTTNSGVRNTQGVYK